MCIDFQGLSLGPIFPPDVGFFAENLFLFRVERDRWPSTAATSRDAPCDVLELRISVRMIGPCACLAIALQ